MALQIHTAPPNTGTAVLGRTLPDLLYAACKRYPDSPALNEKVGTEWQSTTLAEFKDRSENLALGLRSLGLSRGDRVALYMESDPAFCIVDMACMIAGLVDVPIYLTHSNEAVEFVLNHSGASAVVVSNVDHYRRISDVVGRATTVQHCVVAGNPADDSGCLTVSDLEARGRSLRKQDPRAVAELLVDVSANDLATIIYTSGTTGVPKGVMLTHENLTYDGLTSFSGLPDYRRGPNGEVAVSFLPLTHVFARALQYGYVEHGTPVYFTTPDEASATLQDVQPTVFTSVPRVIEKVYARILERGATLGRPACYLFDWALSLAKRYEIGAPQPWSYRVQLALADRLVFSKWRAAIGGRIEYIISGGAALSAELANIFAAAGIQILQGYGLTETSPVISYNRPGWNRAGTVGVPIPGVEVAIAEDGEILTRGPHIMMGYYKNPDKTREVIDDDGWLHTGDIGEFDDNGFLRITDRKKDLFKLSTGKYVMPQPLEHRLAAEPLVDQAVVTGVGRRYCTALIFPSESILRTYAGIIDLDHTLPIQEYFEHPRVIERFQKLIDKANEGMDHWSTIKKFRLIADPLTIENGLLTPTMKVKRAKVNEHFADVIESMYTSEEETALSE